MSKKRLFLIGIPETFITRAISKAQAVGFEVILGDSQANLIAYQDAIIKADQQVVTDYTNYGDLLRVAEELWSQAPLDAIFAFKEHALIHTARLVEHYGLHGNSVETVISCIDKFKARTRLEKAALSGPQFSLIHDIKDVYSFLNQAGGPIILKPHNLIGSVGVTKLLDLSEASSKYAECLKSCKEPLVLAEEFIAGEEISIEAMVFRGKPIIFGITEKKLYPGSFIEAGHTSPYPNRSIWTEMESILYQVVSTLNIVFGPLHLEGFVTENGFVMGEVHTRYGGAHITTITEVAEDCDMLTPIFAELANVEFCPVSGGAKRVAAIRFIDIPPGILKDIIGLDAAMDHSNTLGIDIKCKIGDRISPVRTGKDRIASVIVQAETRQQLEEKFVEIVEMLEFVVE